MPPLETPRSIRRRFASHRCGHRTRTRQSCNDRTPRTPTRRPPHRRHLRRGTSARRRLVSRSTQPPDAPTRPSRHLTIPTTTNIDARGTSRAHVRSQANSDCGTSHGRNHENLICCDQARSNTSRDSRAPSSTRHRRQRLGFSHNARKWFASTEDRKQSRDGECRSSQPPSDQGTTRQRHRRHRHPTAEDLHHN